MHINLREGLRVEKNFDADVIENGTVITLVDPEPMVQPDESEPSGSEYENDNGDEEEEEEEEYLDLEEDEPDTHLKRKQGGGKKQKKGLAARDEISASVAAIIRADALPPRPYVEGVKRKTGNESTR